jgi:acyl-CoA dehydrogenase
MAAIAGNDLAAFDEAIFKHIGFFARNKMASLWLGLTKGIFLNVPGNNDTRRYYRQIARLSAAFALLTDYGLMTLGGSLKRKERVSGCYSDALSNLYLCSCVLKHYENQGCLKEDLPLLHWACRESLYRVEQALADILEKLPLKPVTLLLHVLVFPFGESQKPAKEKLIPQLAAILTTSSPVRDRLTKGIHINENPADPTGRVETAFKAVLAAERVEAKIKQAQKQKQLAKGELATVIKEALSKNVIGLEEGKLMTEAEQARLLAITVDDFKPETI